MANPLHLKWYSTYSAIKATFIKILSIFNPQLLLSFFLQTPTPNYTYFLLRYSVHDNVDEIKDVIFEEFVNCQPSADGIKDVIFEEFVNH